MHFARARLPHHPHNFAAGRAAHQRIVHQNHALALQQVAHRIQLQLHAEVANGLRWLDERAAHIVIADQRVAERQARFRRIAQRRRHARIRHRNHNVGIGRAFARQQTGPASRAIPEPSARTRSNPAAKNTRAQTRTARAAAPAYSARALTPSGPNITISPGSTSCR